MEHSSGVVARPTLNTLGAAARLGAPVTALVQGKGPGVADAAKAIAGVSGVTKVRAPARLAAAA